MATTEAVALQLLQTQQQLSTNSLKSAATQDQQVASLLQQQAEPLQVPVASTLGSNLNTTA